MEELLTIARDVFRDPSLQPSSVLSTAQGYDSMNHAQFVLDIETHYGIRLPIEKVLPEQTLSDVLRTVLQTKG